MIDNFPPLNGPDRPAAIEQCRADYGICTDIIYVGFASSMSGLACDEMFRLASRHGLGFFDEHTCDVGW